MFKRYLVFICEAYYPSGGWGDYAGTFDTEEECIAFISAKESAWSFGHYVDLHTGKVYDK